MSLAQSNIFNFFQKLKFRQPGDRFLKVFREGLK
jgi:hypothetical protein